MERKLVKNITTHFQRKGHQTAVEVPFLSGSIDVVYKTKGGELVAIEAKMSDYKRALNQAKYGLLAASRVYVCLPERSVSEDMRHSFVSLGIGLIHADKRSNGGRYLKFVIRARRNRAVDRSCRSALKKAFLEKAKGE